MNYDEQRQFLFFSRIWAIVFAASLILVAALCVVHMGPAPRSALILFALTVTALVISLYYTPDYLTLTVALDKWLRWEIRIRWRLAGAVLICGMASISTLRGAIMVGAATAWIIGTNVLAKKMLRAGSSRVHFWVSDLTVLIGLLFAGRVNLLLAAALLAAVSHLSLVVCEKNLFAWTVAIPSAGALFHLFLGLRSDASWEFLLAGAALIWIACIGTSCLVHRARMRNQNNVDAAMRELMDFTGYPQDRIWHLWGTSNRQLAKNWQAAAVDENDRDRIASWYRENSELYIFAISAYNLEYKRICSNLKMLHYARGSCLDYGAGNGELVLELARRGHRVTYHDVDGRTMQFARDRARRRGLLVQFTSKKEDLMEAAKENGFDTIFSFDVLEHIPDLSSELGFLSSLLNPGGLFVFDVPAGTTRSHPMHLNHRLDINARMQEMGMIAFKESAPKIPFKKQEKYLFTKPRKGA